MNRHILFLFLFIHSIFILSSADNESASVEITEENAKKEVKRFLAQVAGGEHTWKNSWRGLAALNEQTTSLKDRFKDVKAIRRESVVAIVNERYRAAREKDKARYKARYKKRYSEQAQQKIQEHEARLKKEERELKQSLFDVVTEYEGEMAEKDEILRMREATLNSLVLMSEKRLAELGETLQPRNFLCSPVAEMPNRLSAFASPARCASNSVSPEGSSGSEDGSIHYPSTLRLRPASISPFLHPAQNQPPQWALVLRKMLGYKKAIVRKNAELEEVRGELSKIARELQEERERSHVLGEENNRLQSQLGQRGRGVFGSLMNVISERVNRLFD